MNSIANYPIRKFGCQEYLNFSQYENSDTMIMPNLANWKSRMPKKNFVNSPLGKFRWHVINNLFGNSIHFDVDNQSTISKVDKARRKGF